jgi:hypothetical protein
MSADDFKLANKKQNQGKAVATENRGRKVNSANVPSLTKGDDKYASIHGVIDALESKVPTTKSANINMVIDALDKKTNAPVKLRSAANSQQQFKEVSAYLLFVLTTGLSIAYYVTFRTYHTALQKMESLKKLLANPNARVAAGEKGKSILKRLSADKKKTEAPKKIVKSTKTDETVNLLKQLIDARQTEKQYEAPLLEQEAPKKLTAPKKSANDHTIESIKKALAERKAKVQAPAPVTVAEPQTMYQMPPVGSMPVMQYPVMAPSPMPTIQAQAPIIAAPAPVIAAPAKPAKASLDNMSKQDMIKLLLNELAKPDLEA